MSSMNRRRFCSVITASGILPAFGMGLPSGSQAFGVKKAYPSMIGSLQWYTTTYEDSLVDLARKYGLGYTEIVSANLASETLAQTLPRKRGGAVPPV